MKKYCFLSLLLVCVTGFASVHAAEEKPLLQTGDRPNIVIIFNDDMGYADVGCFGSERNKTPRIDKMAAEGRMFTSFYVASSVCSASRAAVAFVVDGGEKGGTFDFVLGYASPNGAVLKLNVNGTKQFVRLPKTGGWGTFKAAKLNVSLKAGAANKIKIGCSGANLDYFDLKRAEWISNKAIN